ncbi:MAG: hypothetical protein AAGC44_12070 [Planctomycetota bacterium]
MSVQLEQFRVVGVNRSTGEDVSVVIDAATKAAAEVKAEQMDIETTHIVRLKQADEQPPDEHELFSADAAEALSTRRTEKLIEDIATAVPDQDQQAPPSPEPPAPEPAPKNRSAPLTEIVAAINRPAYSSPATRREQEYHSSSTAFLFVLLVLAGLAGGAYFVLVHEPNALVAQEEQLLFGEDLYFEVSPPTDPPAQGPRLDAFNNRPNPQPTDRETTPLQPASPQGSPRHTDDLPPLVLQSIVTSHEGRFAVINGKLYREGAELAGCKLLRVADNWVMMQRGARQFVLEIEAN